MPPMNRRDALRTTTALLGGVLVTTNGFLIACARDPNKSAGKVLSVDDQALIEEIADTLLPTTPSSPGAKAAGAGAAINLLLTDCYEPNRQTLAVSGLSDFRRACRKRFDAEFASLSPADRETFVREIDAESLRARDPHY